MTRPETTARLRGLLDVPGWAGSAESLTPSTRFSLAPGAYRLFLFSNAPTSLRITLPGRITRAMHAVSSGAALATSVDTFGRLLPPYQLESHNLVGLSKPFVLQGVRWRLHHLPAADHTFNATLRPAAGNCARSASQPASPLPIIEKPYDVVLEHVAQPAELAFSGTGCAASTYQGSDYASEADSVAVLVSL